MKRDGRPLFLDVCQIWSCQKSPPSLDERLKKIRNCLCWAAAILERSIFIGTGKIYRNRVIFFFSSFSRQKQTLLGEKKNTRINRAGTDVPDVRVLASPLMAVYSDKH